MCLCRFAFVLISVLSTASVADPLVFNYPVNIDKPCKELQAVTAFPAVFRGHFLQNKRVAVLNRPLRSEGVLLSVKGRGLFWQTLRPVKSRYSISAKGIKNLESKTLMPGAGISQSLGGVFSALLSGDLSTLSSFFQVYFYPDAESEADTPSWTIGLIPKQHSLIAKGVARIVLTGGEYIQSINIDETNGDKTELQFFSIQTTPETLSVEEEQYFAE